MFSRSPRTIRTVFLSWLLSHKHTDLFPPYPVRRGSYTQDVKTTLNPGLLSRKPGFFFCSPRSSFLVFVLPPRFSSSFFLPRSFLLVLPSSFIPPRSFLLVLPSSLFPLVLCRAVYGTVFCSLQLYRQHLFCASCYLEPFVYSPSYEPHDQPVAVGDNELLMTLQRFNLSVF